MDETSESPWWHTPLRVAGVLSGLLALAAVSMALIFLLAKVLDRLSQPLVEVSAPPPHEQNARTRVASPYGLAPWPDSPGRKPAVSKNPGDSLRSMAGGGSAATGESRDATPVGVSTTEYRAAVESGRKFYLPDPKGACDLSGTSTAQSMQALENCLAQQAAR